MHRQDDQTQMPIASVSSLLGIPIPTIRSWERRYGFPVPSRTLGQHRRYSLDEIDQLRMVRDEITRGHNAREAVDVVRRSTTEARPRTELLDRFLVASMNLDPSQLREILTEGTEQLGVEPTIRDVALPAMREMGSRWKAGVCDTAHEHLATEAVRVWLARQSAMAPVLMATLSAPARSRTSTSRTVLTPPPTVSGMKTVSAVRRTTSRVVSRPSLEAEMSRNVSSSAPSAS